MDDTFREFNRRHRAINKKHRKLAQGYVTKLNRNGVIEHCPLNQSKIFSLRGLIFIVSAFLFFKGYVLAGLGTEQYAVHVAALAEGNPFEKAGAWLMQAEPASMFIAQAFASMGV